MADKKNIEIVRMVVPVYERLSARYTAKVAVSAGILLLSRLEPSERDSIIDEINGFNEQSEREAARADEAVAAQRSEARRHKKPKHGSA